MKKLVIILAIVLAVLLALLTLTLVFWDQIIDYLPIDQSGWEQTEEGLFYLNEKGDPLTGWQTLEEKTYYFDPQTGYQQTGWLELDRNTYYLDPNPVTGWQTIDSEEYYFSADGTLFSGWLEGTQYLQAGQPLSGWQQIDGKALYLDSQGRLLSGWQDTPTGRFYLASGSICTGLTQTEEGTYYFNEDGSIYRGWVVAEALTYYFGADGLSQTGWIEDGGKEYYLKEDQTLAKGKLVIDETNYFFTSTGVSIILVNPWNKLPEDYSVELVTGPDDCRVSPEILDALNRMLADCYAAGYSPYVASSYRSVSTQQYLLDKKIQEWKDMGYGEEAAYYYATQIVAVPGTSEHHLGYVVDIIDSAYTVLGPSQAERPTQQWLMEHCWEYGFIMRYPFNTTDITGIVYEPWHYRYVGTELSMELKELGVCLETYLDNLTGDGSTCGGKYIEMED